MNQIELNDDDDDGFSHEQQLIKSSQKVKNTELLNIIQARNNEFELVFFFCGQSIKNRRRIWLASQMDRWITTTDHHFVLCLSFILFQGIFFHLQKFEWDSIPKKIYKKFHHCIGIFLMLVSGSCCCCCLKCICEQFSGFCCFCCCLLLDRHCYRHHHHHRCRRLWRHCLFVRFLHRQNSRSFSNDH